MERVRLGGRENVGVGLGGGGRGWGWGWGGRENVGVGLGGGGEGGVGWGGGRECEGEGGGSRFGPGAPIPPNPHQWHDAALSDEEVSYLFSARHTDARETWGPSLSPTTTFYPSSPSQRLPDGIAGGPDAPDQHGGNTLRTTPHGGFMPTMLDGSTPTAVRGFGC